MAGFRSPGPNLVNFLLPIPLLWNSESCLCDFASSSSFCFKVLKLATGQRWENTRTRARTTQPMRPPLARAGPFQALHFAQLTCHSASTALLLGLLDQLLQQLALVWAIPRPTRWKRGSPTKPPNQQTSGGPALSNQHFVSIGCDMVVAGATGVPVVPLQLWL